MRLLLAIDMDTLLNCAQQLEARCDPVFIATELRTLVARAKPSADPKLAAALYAALSNFPCTCIEVGAWPRFKPDVKSHPERQCAKHAAMRAWEKENGLEEKP